MQLAVAARRRGVARLAQVGEAVLHRAGSDRRLAGLQMGARRTAVAACASRGAGVDLGRAAHRRRRLGAELVQEQAPACGDLRERAGAVAASGERAHQQLVVGLLERVERHEARRDLGGLVGVPAASAIERRLVQHRGGLTGVARPRSTRSHDSNAGLAAELHVAEQLAARRAPRAADVRLDAVGERRS